MTFQIVILALIAAFLGLRLYSVLGRRAEHEEEPIAGRFDEKTGVGKSSLPAPRSTLGRDAQAGSAKREMNHAIPAVERGIREIAAADRRFDLLTFVEGAQGAYRMVLEAFWRGDKEHLAELCDRDVYESFAAAIDARAAAGETLDNRLIRIEESTIVAASYEASIARISVRFAADVASVTRDSSGQVIAGSLNDAIDSRDTWTFTRDVTAQSPAWLLDETDEG